MVIKCDQATFHQLRQGVGGSLWVRGRELLRKVPAVRCMFGVKRRGASVDKNVLGEAAYCTMLSSFDYVPG